MSYENRGPGAAVMPLLQPLERTYTCAGPMCVTTERAAYMFNLTCDPRKTTYAELLKLIRCRKCAYEIVNAHGRELEEGGCGVYPLRLTLRWISDDNEPIPDGVPTFGCAQPGCEKRHLPERMYNLAPDRLPTRVEAILPLIRCETHAIEHAIQYGLAPCEPGSNVYRLSHTLKKVEERARTMAAAERNVET